MEISKWITVNANGSCKITAGKPKLAADEIAMLLKFDIPDSFFEKPTIEATITIPKRAVIGGVIDPVITDNLQDVVEQTTGLNISLVVGNPQDDFTDG